MPLIGAVVKRAMQLKKTVSKHRQPGIHYQKKALKRLLKKASNTEFGLHYDFKSILKSKDIISAFQQNIPIHNYDKLHDEWWYRSLKKEHNICWPGEVKLFALSSGTTGSASKHIPITSDMLRSIRRAGVRMFYNTTQFNLDTAFYEKDIMMFGGSTNLQEKEGVKAGDLSGINTSRLPMWVRRFYRPGTEISGLNDWNDRIEQIAKEAPNWDVGIVAGIPSWIQLMMERVIEYNNVDNIHDVWPNFQFYVSGGVAFKPYQKGFEKLLGRSIEYMDSYLASEGFIAIQSRIGTNGMEMILDNGIFYEFIPFNDTNFNAAGEVIGQPQTLTVEDLEEGVDYALILTSCSGAWRYLLGDMIQVVNKELCEIVITGRTKHFLSICGEHLSIGNMNDGIRLVEEELNVNIREYTVSGIELSEGKFAHKWYIGCESYLPAAQIQAVLDAKLRELNDDYSTERDAFLGMEVEIVTSNLFYDWFESKGKLGGQNKVPRVMKKELFEEWENFVQTKV